MFESNLLNVDKDLLHRVCFDFVCAEQSVIVVIFSVMIVSLSGCKSVFVVSSNLKFN